MKSLEERKAQRAQHKAKENKEREESPKQAPADGEVSSMDTGEGESKDSKSAGTGGSQGAGSQGAKGYLAANAGDVIAKINADNLTDEHLAELEKIEGENPRKRTSVLDAISKARTKLKAASSGWGNNV